MFLSVDLPAPFSPTIARARPAAALNETLERTVTPENDFPMPSSDRTVVFSCVTIGTRFGGI